MSCQGHARAPSTFVAPRPSDTGLSRYVFDRAHMTRPINRMRPVHPGDGLTGVVWRDRAAPARCVALMSPDAGLKATVSFSTSLHATGRRGAWGGVLAGADWEVSTGSAVPASAFGPVIPMDVCLLSPYVALQLANQLTFLVQPAGSPSMRPPSGSKFDANDMGGDALHDSDVLYNMPTMVSRRRGLLSTGGEPARRSEQRRHPHSANARLVAQDRPPATPKAAFAVIEVHALQCLASKHGRRQ